MPLKIRLDTESGVLRSVGDPPHGIIGLSAIDGGLCFHVDGEFMPEGKRPGPHISHHPAEEASKVDVVEVDDLVAACEGQEELGTVWRMVEEITVTSVSIFTKRGDFDVIRGHVDTLEATCRAIVARLEEEGEIGP